LRGAECVFLLTTQNGLIVSKPKIYDLGELDQLRSRNLSVLSKGIKVKPNRCGVDVACKYVTTKRWTVEEAWVYSNNGRFTAGGRRLGITDGNCEEIFRDCQSGGDNLEGTEVNRRPTN